MVLPDNIKKPGEITEEDIHQLKLDLLTEDVTESRMIRLKKENEWLWDVLRTAMKWWEKGYPDGMRKIIADALISKETKE